MVAVLQALQRYTREPHTPIRVLTCAACRRVLRKSRGVGKAVDVHMQRFLTMWRGMWSAQLQQNHQCGVFGAGSVCVCRKQCTSQVLNRPHFVPSLVAGKSFMWAVCVCGVVRQNLSNCLGHLVLCQCRHPPPTRATRTTRSHISRRPVNTLDAGCCSCVQGCCLLALRATVGFAWGFCTSPAAAVARLNRVSRVCSHTQCATHAPVHHPSPRALQPHRCFGGPTPTLPAAAVAAAGGLVCRRRVGVRVRAMAPQVQPKEAAELMSSKGAKYLDVRCASRGGPPCARVAAARA
jgi:hypothetical protein